MVDINRRDSNRRRWKTTAAWSTIQKAFDERIEGDYSIEELQSERKRQVNKDRAEKAIAGYTTTYAAWLQDEVSMEDDASVVVQRLYNKMLEIWDKKGENFHSLRIKKQFDYHIS